MSKTMTTYTFIMIASAMITKEVMDVPSLTGCALILSGFVFLHTLISPLSNDRKYIYFKTTPGKT